MAEELIFDRDAVGLALNEHWDDAEEFGRISVTGLSINMFSAAGDLPAGDNAGVRALRSVGLGVALRNILAEYGDACAILGSGTEDTIRDFDDTEYQNTYMQTHLQQRLGGGPLTMEAL